LVPKFNMHDESSEHPDRVVLIDGSRSESTYPTPPEFVAPSVFENLTTANDRIHRALGGEAAEVHLVWEPMYQASGRIIVQRDLLDDDEAEGYYYRVVPLNRLFQDT